MSLAEKKSTVDPDLLGRMTLEDVLPMAERLSGRSRQEIADHGAINCSLDVLVRAFNPGDPSYFVSFGRVPGLCVAMGHDLLLSWAKARFDHLAGHFGLDLDPVRPVDLRAALVEFARLAKEQGDVARALADASADNRLDQAECRRLMRELLDVQDATQHLYAGLAATLRQGREEAA